MRKSQKTRRIKTGKSSWKQLMVEEWEFCVSVTRGKKYLSVHKMYSWSEMQFFAELQYLDLNARIPRSIIFINKKKNG